METVKFTVPGDPVAKGRPRVVTNANGDTRTYTPTKTVNAEARILQAWADAGQPQIAGDVPIVIWVYFYLRKPKSAPKKRVYPHYKPDLDNLLKLVLDALTGWMWVDDKQIVNIATYKRYDVNPRIEIVASRVI